MANAVNAETLNDKPITSYDDFLSLFHAAVKPASEFRVGAEMEKFGVYEDGTPVPYEGDSGVRAILEELAKKGWKPEAESEGGPLIALLRDGASVTLEPGSQLELSGAPLLHAHQICAEFRAHLAEIAPFSQEKKIHWLGLGFHPFATRDAYTMVPKQRYAIMREYLPTRGSLALDMMLRTSTVQANYDYLSEADAMVKMRVALKLSPLTTAMFANSPFYEGQPFGGKSYRAKVWLDTDPDRSGLVPSLWKKNASFVDYVEWALDVPMFMFKRDGEKVVNTGQTFRSFWKSGFSGHKPTMSDWQTHLNTLFPEVRLKKTIEVRGADAQGATAGLHAARALDRDPLRRQGARRRRSDDRRLDPRRGQRLAQGDLAEGPRREVPRRHAPAVRREADRDCQGRPRASRVPVVVGQGRARAPHAPRGARRRGEDARQSPPRRAGARAEHARRDHPALRSRHRLKLSQRSRGHALTRSRGHLG